MSQNDNNIEVRNDGDNRRRQVLELLEMGVDSVHFQHGTVRPIFTRQEGRESSWPTVSSSFESMPHI